jgi:cytochrome oxidase Cu insertion factor (SCO1/SenC/PrrC family)
VRQFSLWGNPYMNKDVLNRIGGWAAVTAIVLSLFSPALAQSKEAAKPAPSLKVGDVAPDFKLQYFDGKDLKDVSLSDFRGKKNVVLAFYVFAFTGG